jgi:hypothetical protein
MKSGEDRKQLRSFGLLVGGIFVAIALWPVIVRGGPARVWALVLGIGLVIPALIAPRSLQPIYRMWMALAAVLAWINTRIVLGLIFFGLITPVGLVRRAFNDPLARAFDADVDTYRVPQRRRSRNHLRHQF